MYICVFIYTFTYVYLYLYYKYTYHIYLSIYIYILKSWPLYSTRLKARAACVVYRLSPLKSTVFSDTVDG